MRSGADNLLQKPIDPEELRTVIERSRSGRHIRAERDRLREELHDLKAGPMVGRSRALSAVLEQIERVAATPRTTVLVLGESGTGKELVARAIHDQSDRATGPFVALNCAALSGELLEAELFGYEPGAFTGGNPKAGPHQLIGDRHPSRLADMGRDRGSRTNDSSTLRARHIHLEKLEIKAQSGAIPKKS